MIKVESPTRIDLSGGTLDCWPLFNFVKSACTINLAIDIKTKVSLLPNADSTDASITVDIKNLNFKKKYSSREEFLKSQDPEVRILWPHVNYWGCPSGFSLTTESESPVGGGLGGSSSLTVSLLKAFGEWLGHKMDVHAQVRLASNMEAHLLHTPTGIQDYYPALEYGLNAIHLNVEGPALESLPFDIDYFSDRILLVYTGHSHHSGINNWQVLKNAVEKDRQTLMCLQEIADISQEMLKVCRTQNWSAMPDLFEQEFKARIMLEKTFSSPEILRLKEIAASYGVPSVKICGAGGGGCVLIWVEPELREEVLQQCQNEKMKPLKAYPIISS